ncbi:MAG: HAD family phosphatase [Chitinophagaceae bacterium]|jgi:2-haloacid dehalogenase|nr:HAD family phosphatase [Chitinophagaceae bacterium]OQY93361.1 MAG: HAD family hydrolase [Sphingobacteriales bacterium UTBCD1]
MATIDSIIFDLGGVLIDWNPRYVYRDIFRTEEEMEWFLQHVTTTEWNENQDAGYPLHKATEELAARHPEWDKEIRAFYGRWLEMLGDAIQETVDLFHELKQADHYRLYALTNWSAELFPHARERFEFLKWFNGIVVSGEEKTRKPFPEFYKILLDRYHLDPGKTIFIDDNLKNVKGAEVLGITGIHFHNAQQLKEELQRLGVRLGPASS